MWKFGKFLETLDYFEVFPVLSCLKRLFSGTINTAKQQLLGEQKMGLILVVGATGGVGKRVVKKLLENGYEVRVLVRDAKRAKQILGDRIELIEGDITIPATLTPELMTNITAVICCTGTKVQPIEGDTPTREKYYQGIKFYLPEIVDIPEMVEYEGIKNLTETVVKYLPKTEEKIIFDFTKPTTDIKEIWGAVDDVVMGGVSESNIRLINNIALFSGYVSTANSGGFASVRTRNFNPPFNLSEYSGIELRIKGDGNRYKVFLRTESTWDGIGYSYSFDTIKNTWQNIQVPFNQLIPVFRAKTVPNCPPIDQSKICAVQLMLSKFEYDGQYNPAFTEGLFTLEVEYIKAIGGQRKPQFIMISSAGVTRVGRPGLDLEKEPPAVRLNDQLGGLLTWKLKGEETVKSSGLSYTIIRPCALTEEDGGKVLIFEQGDNMKGKVSREDIAQLCVKVLEIPSACDKIFEVKESEYFGSNKWEEVFNDLLKS